MQFFCDKLSGSSVTDGSDFLHYNFGRTLANPRLTSALGGLT